MVCLFVFFFKQKTAYEMRISDWSSDVCSSDLIEEGPGLLDAIADEALDIEDCVIRTDIPQLSVLPAGARSHDDTELLASDRAGALLDALVAEDLRRSDERRVGKECVQTGRYRG